MKIAPAISFALAAIVAGDTLPAASSYAQTYSAAEQACGSGDTGADHCSYNSSNKVGDRHDFQNRTRTDGKV